MAEQRRRGFRRWFSGPPGTGYAFRYAREGLEGATDGINTLKPKRFDRIGFFGRDHDGGIARFRAMSEDLSSDEIMTARYAWERDRGVFLVVCIGLICALPISALYGLLTWPFGLGLVAGAAFMGVRAAVADFRTWQIQQARFGAPVEYLNHRLPRNMQIMERDSP